MKGCTPSIWELCKRRINGCVSIESTIVQTSNRRLHKCRINGWTSVNLTVAQALIWWLCKPRIDNCTNVESNGCTNVESTIVQESNRRLHKCRFEGCTSINLTIAQASNWRLYWLFQKKKALRTLNIRW